MPGTVRVRSSDLQRSGKASALQRLRVVRGGHAQYSTFDRMDRVLTSLIVFGILCGCGGGPSDPQPAPLKPDVVQCPAALFLIQAPEGMPELELDFGLSDMEFREHVAEQLGNDTCRYEGVAICLPRPIEVEGAIITKVRAKLRFYCDWQSTYHRERVSILVNSTGQILCEGEMVQLEEVPGCYRRVFASAVSDDFPFVALGLDWSGADPSLIGEILTVLSAEHWTNVKQLSAQKGGMSICSLGEEELRNFAGPFEVLLLSMPVPPPPSPITKDIHAPTIFWEKLEHHNDSLDK